MVLLVVVTTHVGGEVVVLPVLLVQLTEDVGDDVLTTAVDSVVIKSSSCVEPRLTGSSVTNGSDPELSKQSSSSQGRSTGTTTAVVGGFGFAFGGRVGGLYTGVIKSSGRNRK